MLLRRIHFLEETRTQVSSTPTGRWQSRTGAVTRMRRARA
jgi:hypothetical protein